MHAIVSTWLCMGLLLSSNILHATGTDQMTEKHQNCEVAVLETTEGKIVLELDATKAPKTVENFVEYVKGGHYDGTIFHRVIQGFMVQGGGFDADLVQKPTKPPIVNEATNGLTNMRGTIAMSRTADVSSATAQFFINLVDNDFLNHRNTTESGFGYCVFGKVVEGMDVVDAIASKKTSTQAGFNDVPVEAVTITSASILCSKPNET